MLPDWRETPAPLGSPSTASRTDAAGHARGWCGPIVGETCILPVEDQACILEVMEQYLEREGHMVLRAAACSEALDIAVPRRGDRRRRRDDAATFDAAPDVLGM